MARKPYEDDIFDAEAELGRLHDIYTRDKNIIYEKQQKLKVVKQTMDALRPLVKKSKQSKSAKWPKGSKQPHNDDALLMPHQYADAPVPVRRVANWRSRSETAEEQQAAIARLLYHEPLTIGQIATALGVEGVHQSYNLAYKTVENNLKQVRHDYNVWRKPGRGRRGSIYWIEKDNSEPPKENRGWADHRDRSAERAAKREANRVAERRRRRR